MTESHIYDTQPREPLRRKSALMPPLYMGPSRRNTASDPRRIYSLEAQPFFVNSPYGLSMSVNGNLVNAPDLVEFLDSKARRHVNTDSDSEVL